MKTYQWIMISVLFSPMAIIAQNKTTISLNLGHQSHIQNAQIHQTYFIEKEKWEDAGHTNISDESFASSKSILLGMEWNIARFKYGFRNQISYQGFSSSLASTGEIVAETSDISFASYAIDQGLIVGYQFLGGKGAVAEKGISITPRANLGVSRRRSKISQRVIQSSSHTHTRYSHSIATLHAAAEIELAYHFNEKLQLQVSTGAQQTDFSFEAYGANDTPRFLEILPAFRTDYNPRPNYSAFYVNAGVSMTF